MRFFVKQPIESDVLEHLIEFRNGKKMTVRALIESFERLNADDKIQWITVKGNHIPIKPGQTVREAVTEHFEKAVSAKRAKRATDEEKPKKHLYYKPVKGTMNIVQSHKGKTDGTYSMNDDKVKTYDTGYSFSFHQNEPDENGNFKSAYGRYTPEEYDRIANEIAEEYDLSVDVGVFEGGAEISFHTDDLEVALAMMVKFNQKSIWDFKNMLPIENKDDEGNWIYDAKENPMP